MQPDEGKGAESFDERLPDAVDLEGLLADAVDLEGLLADADEVHDAPDGSGVEAGSLLDSEGF